MIRHWHRRARNFIVPRLRRPGNNHQTHNVWRASASYVTGAHSMKVGYQAAYEVTDIFGNYASHGLQYRFSRAACRT